MGFKYIEGFGDKLPDFSGDELYFKPDLQGNRIAGKKVLHGYLRTTDVLLLRYSEETIMGISHKYSDKQIKIICEMREKYRSLLRQFST